MSARNPRPWSFPGSLSSRRRGWRRHRFAPALLPLETRALLSTLTVTNDNDSGTGSLRYELGLAQPDSTIDFAPSAYGTIALTSGPLSVGTSVDVQGPGASKVTVDGGGKSSDFTIAQGVEATISGLTITGGSVATPGTFGGGGITSYGTLSLDHVVVSGNSVGAGAYGAGGILTVGALSINDSAISDNSTTGNQGGGIFDFGHDVSVTDSTVSGNNGGIYIDGAGVSPMPTLTVTDSSISGNTITVGPALGAGIEAGGANVTISGSVLADNTASSGLSLGGAIHIDFSSPSDSSVLTITDSTFIGNQALAPSGGTVGGGAIYTDPGATISISRTQFVNNTASSVSGAGGGALDLNQLAKGTITDSAFIGNQAILPASTPAAGPAANGGAIELQGYGGALAISGSTFAGNQANAGAASGLGIGGAILNQGGSVLDLSNSLVMNNSAIGGAASSSDPYGGFGAGGGLVNQFGATATVTDSTFLGNRAVGGASAQPGGHAGPAWGGAILNAIGSTLTLTGGLIAGNAALGGNGSNGAVGGIAQGGGMYNGSKLEASGVAVLLNAAVGGSGGGNGEGGGVFVSGSGASASLTDMLITLNSAVGGSGGGSGYGGGLYISTGAVTLKNTRVVANHASTADDDIYGTYTNG